MKAIFLALFIVAVSATPLPKDNDAVEMILNGMPPSNGVSVVDNELSVERFLHSMPEVVRSNPKLKNSQPILVSEQLPVAAPQFNGKVYNDGPVQVQYNGPEDPGMLATLQDWFNVVVKYFNSPSSPAAPGAPAAALQPRH